MQRTELRMDVSSRTVADLYQVAVLVFWGRDDENELRCVLSWVGPFSYTIFSPPETLGDWVRVRGCDGLMM